MDRLSRSEMIELLDQRRGPCVSIFMPVHRAGIDIQQNPIRFKNLLREAVQKLAEAGIDQETERLLEPAERLLDDGELFWQNQRQGIALFRSREIFRYYRLPFEPKSAVVVGERFSILPLLPFLSDGGAADRFYILALSLKQVRLFKATRFSSEEIEPGRAPRSMAEALRYDDVQKADHVFAGSQGRAAGGVTAVAGHGVAVGDEKHEPNDDLVRYFRQVDAGLYDVLRHQRVPLVLAAVEYLHPIYQGVCTYPSLVTGGVTGSPDVMSGDELHARAWPVVELHLHAAREEAASQYRRLAGTPRVSNDLRKIVPAAFFGRVGLLFVAPEAEQWGRFDAESNELELHPEPQPGDQDLVNAVVGQTILHGGKVYPIGVEEELLDVRGTAVAVFRY
jgi:hypothetical protein